MPSVSDYTHRPWSSGFSLGFGPLHFDPPRLPDTPVAPPVTGAKGGKVVRIGDARDTQAVRPI